MGSDPLSTLYHRKREFIMTLKELEIGKYATIVSVGGSGALRQHILDMGVTPGTEVTVVKYAPMGDPVEIRVHGYELTLRLDDAAKIEIQPIPASVQKEEQRKEKQKKHHFFL